MRPQRRVTGSGSAGRQFDGRDPRESPLRPPRAFGWRPQEEAASCVIWTFVILYEEPPDESRLRPSALCCHLLLLLSFFFLLGSLVAPLSTLSDFQISVCRGMCHFQTDDLVFYTRTILTNIEGPSPHTLRFCQHWKPVSFFYRNSVYSKE